VCAKFENPRKYGRWIDAKEDTCCAWWGFKELEKKGMLAKTEYCGIPYDEVKKMTKGAWNKKGVSPEEVMRSSCCADEMSDSYGDCDRF